MAKVAIIGAGSIVFCKTLILDILATPGWRHRICFNAPSTGGRLMSKNLLSGD